MNGSAAAGCRRCCHVRPWKGRLYQPAVSEQYGLGIGVAGIGQLADISIGHVARRGKITGVPVGREDAGQASGVSLLLCGRAAGSRSRRRVMTALAALPACGLVLLPGRVSPSPGRLRGQLGAGGDV